MDVLSALNYNNQPTWFPHKLPYLRPRVPIFVGEFSPAWKILVWQANGSGQPDAKGRYFGSGLYLYFPSEGTGIVNARLVTRHTQTAMAFVQKAKRAAVNPTVTDFQRFETTSYGEHFYVASAWPWRIWIEMSLESRKQLYKYHHHEDGKPKKEEEKEGKEPEPEYTVLVSLHGWLLWPFRHQDPQAVTYLEPELALQDGLTFVRGLEHA